MSRSTKTDHASRAPANALAALLVGAALALAPRASAQIVQIPDSVVTSVALDSTGRAAIDEFVQAHRDNLLSDDWRRVQQARDAILNQLDDPAVSVAFRQAFASALIPLLNQRLDDGGPGRRFALTALRVLGRLATEDALRVIERRFNATDEQERFFAAFSVELAFDEIASKAPAVTEDRAKAVARRLGEILESAGSPVVAGAALRALEAARDAERSIPGMRALAIDLIARHAGERLRRVNPTDTQEARERTLALAAAETLRREVVDPTNPMSKDTARLLIAFGGDIAAHLLRRADRDLLDFDQPDRYDLLLAGVGQTLALFGIERFNASGGQTAARPPVDLADRLESGEPAAFRADALQLIGPNGALVLPPLSINADRFTLGG